MKKSKLVLAFAVMALVVGCEKTPEVSFATQEAARAQVLENAQFNANKWRNEYAAGAKIMMRGDSTISAKCITGDGWVTVDLLNDSGESYKKLKCSSVSGTIGCMTAEDFKARGDYSSQDGQCNTALPFPLPKITQ
jgi:hypothetical protein